MSSRGSAERNLPSFFANSFGTLVHFKVDCKAEELTQGQHLVIMMMDTSLEEDSQTSSILRVYYEPSTSSTPKVGLLFGKFKMVCVETLLVCHWLFVSSF